jgi:hypothetical protein
MQYLADKWILHYDNAPLDTFSDKYFLLPEQKQNNMDRNYLVWFLVNLLFRNVNVFGRVYFWIGIFYIQRNVMIIETTFDK